MTTRKYKYVLFIITKRDGDFSMSFDEYEGARGAYNRARRHLGKQYTRVRLSIGDATIAHAWVSENGDIVDVA